MNINKPITNLIVEYDGDWPHKFVVEAVKLKAMIPECVNLHHIGSTAVPGLAAKPEIDILLEVPLACIGKDFTSGLTPLGYRRGGNLSNGQQFYKKDVRGCRTHKLHICSVSHKAVIEMIQFRNFLRENKVAKKAYEQLKLKLSLDTQCNMHSYLQGKSDFIQGCLQQ